MSSCSRTPPSSRHLLTRSPAAQNDQIDVALNSFLASKALANPSQKLSAEGRALVADFRQVVEQAKLLLLSKNSANLTQDCAVPFAIASRPSILANTGSPP